jgi:hypothetical protein
MAVAIDFLSPRLPFAVSPCRSAKLANSAMGSERPLTRILHESPAATKDMGVLPAVLGCRLLRRTVQVRLGTNTLRLPGGTPIFTVSRLQFMQYPG